MSPELKELIFKTPMLTADEERTLFEQLRGVNDPKSARAEAIRDRIIMAHLRMCYKVASQWHKSSRIPVEDLFQEGQVGLLTALKKFDVDKGNRFSTYAQWWIKAEVQGHVQQQSSAMKTNTTAFQKFLFGNYFKYVRALQKHNAEMSDEEIDSTIAQRLIDEGHSSYTYDKTLKEIKTFKVGKSTPASMSAPIGEEGTELGDLLPGSLPTGEEALVKKDESRVGLEFLVAGLARLKPREREILTARRLDDPKKTLEDLSSVYGVSRERIRQIEVAALKKLKGFAKKEFSASATLGAVKSVKQARKRSTYTPPKTGPKTKPSVNGAIVKTNSLGTNSVRDAFVRFQQTGVASATDVKLFRDKFFQMHQGQASIRKRNWDIFYRNVLQVNPERNADLSQAFGIESSHISTITARITETLLQNDPFMPSDDYLMYLHQKYLDSFPPKKANVDRDWDIWLRLNAQIPKCKNAVVGRVYGIDHSAVSMINKRMRGKIQTLTDKFPEEYFIARRDVEAFHKPSDVSVLLTHA